LNSIGYVAYEYTIPIFIYYFGILKEKIYLIGLVPVILLTFFALINKFEWGAMLFIIGLNYIILIITCLLKKRFYGQTNHTVFYLFSIVVTVVSPMVNALLFHRREVGLWDAVTLGIGSVAIVSLWKYYLQNQKNFLEKINTKIIERNYDELTKVKNFRSLNEDISKLVINEKDQLVVVMMDLDHFKQINDHHGHQIGNQALTFFSDKLTTFLYQKSPSHLIEVYRYGGEEFLVLFKENTSVSVKKIIEEFHLFLSNEQLKLEGTQLTLYFSAGISEAGPTLDISEIFYQADQALYEAKRKGRNRTIIFS
jgi:diguanylate cyclase (GGDEF)-like protein